MSFGRSEKVLHEDTQYNPPPGYYNTAINPLKPSFNSHSFTKGQRFTHIPHNVTPGPGAFHNHTKDNIKQRILQQSKKMERNFDANSSNIKISSIPSIPKKSTTRVYEELAPGILILHEEEYENANVGPGSYNIGDVLKKKPVAHKINPEHKKKFIDPADIPPAINDLVRDEKKLLYKKKTPIKASNVQKNILNPSDLCLEVIILREKLLRGDEVPPPGYYYNPDYDSTFKPKEPDRPPQLQLLAGREERFKPTDKASEIGPGTYEQASNAHNQGGFIPREERHVCQLPKDTRPGPTSYQAISLESVKEQPKGNYPAIFGSGCARFYSGAKLSEHPGPGAYKLNDKKNKKLKYIKIRKDLTQVEVEDKNHLIDDPSQDYQTDYAFNSKPRKNKNTSNFSSKVERFIQRSNGDGLKDYNPYQSSVVKQTLNRSQGGYIGSRNPRFKEDAGGEIGPGTYDANYSLIRQKKVHNIII